MTGKKKINTKNTPIRERILTTALKLFYENGIQAVGVDKIVAEARVAKMTLYSYFASKEDLIYEYLDVISDKWFEDFHKFLNKNCKTDKDRLKGAFLFLKNSYESVEQFRGSAFVNAGLEIADPKHPVHGLILENQEILRESFENWAYNSGLSNARQLSYSLLNLFHGATVAAVIEDFPEPITHAVKTVDILIKAHEA
ncbi:MAG: TetR/AcrR family transcriptional regulator [Lentisphaeraceae bacterium]|nr:TetR/AcrR family transcriptional regulator [Lentisphaeraceae bacterium]